MHNPEKYQAYFVEAHMAKALYTFGSPSIKFSEKDCCWEQESIIDPYMSLVFCDKTRVNRILVDPGSSVNLMILKTIHALILKMYYLSAKKIVVRGFNLHSQKPLRSITVLIEIGKLTSEVKFHIINTDVSYRAL